MKTLMKFLAVSLLFMGGCAYEVGGTPEVTNSVEKPVAEVEYTVHNFYAASSAVNIRLGSGGLCSGVVISEHEILTAKHCILLNPVGIIELPGVRITGVWNHPAKDMGVIAVENVNNIYIAQIAEYAPERGEALYLVGYGCNGIREVRKLVYDYPVLNDWDTRDAETVPTTENPLPQYQFTLRTLGCACNGDSGGGVFNAEGKLVAVHSSANTTENYVCGTVSGEISIEDLPADRNI